MPEKKPIGFHTPNKEIQDASAALQEELSAKKADWQSIQSEWEKLEVSFRNNLQSSLKTGKEAIIIEMSTHLLIAMLAKQTSRLGIELTETHNRLAAVEKAVKEMKLLVK